MSHRSLVSLACFAAAGVWPTLVNAFGSASMSPLQRAVRDSFCGSPNHTTFEMLGHCATCWVGSAILIAMGLVVLARSRADETRLRA